VLVCLYSIVAVSTYASKKQGVYSLHSLCVCPSARRLALMPRLSLLSPASCVVSYGDRRHSFSQALTPNRCFDRRRGRHQGHGGSRCANQGRAFFFCSDIPDNSRGRGESRRSVSSILLVSRSPRRLAFRPMPRPWAWAPASSHSSCVVMEVPVVVVARLARHTSNPS
jgi:hypothetical protein